MLALTLLKRCSIVCLHTLFEHIHCLNTCVACAQHSPPTALLLAGTWLYSMQSGALGGYAPAAVVLCSNHQPLALVLTAADLWSGRCICGSFWSGQAAAVRRPPRLQTPHCRCSCLLPSTSWQRDVQHDLWWTKCFMCVYVCACLHMWSLWLSFCAASLHGQQRSRLHTCNPLPGCSLRQACTTAHE